MTIQPLQQPFCTTREAAAMLGVSLRTAQLWAESGLLTAWKTRGGHRRITLESVENLRSKPVNQVVEMPIPVAAAAVAPFHILVAEDDLIFQDLYQAMIENWAMQPKLSIAGNGFDALVRIGQERPDLLITDLDMPGMDGFEMLRMLKAMPDLADLQIIVVTGLSDAQIEQRHGLPAGVPVLHKPIQFDRLERLAQTCLAGRDALPQRR
jgi:excisionase family DNA binding protein